MKQDKTQQEIQYIKDNLSALYNMVTKLNSRLNNLLVQECSICGHETLQVERADWAVAGGSSIGYAGSPFTPADHCAPGIVYYVCLTCGSKFKLVDKKVFEPYVPKSDG